MRSRIVDIALLVGLVAVGGGILWTLFTLGSAPRTAAPEPPAQSAPIAPTTPGPSAGMPATPPLADGGADGGANGGANGGVVAIDPDDPSDDPVDAVDAEAEAVPDEDVAAVSPDDEVADADAPVVPIEPGGTVDLERVGFSFVTGGAGACSVVLEAWTHVAVSRDLLAGYGCGAEVLVTLSEPIDGRSEVVAVIGDTMNPSFERTVNVYVAEDEPAFEYGTISGTLTDR